MYQHSKVALKGKYININLDDKESVRRAQQEGNLHELLLERRKSHPSQLKNALFLSMKPDAEGYVHVTSRKAEADEMIKLRTDSKKEGPIDWRSEEDRKSAAECETSYVKMYQHSKVALKGKYININLDDKESVRRAQQEGNLHELLLERRVKTKSDKYC
ncbi:hypothetical protein WUBG_14924 [Wuchereria bancrofti]|uniref:Uncharacterized protein n=1 Tax=Wuchereria bancrofti TaxID=6293 RepID=J9EFJ3_WUCBA|nr:hypothetical protein WUBG_14924 [Wuchereria bancrofti]